MLRENLVPRRRCRRYAEQAVVAVIVERVDRRAHIGDTRRVVGAGTRVTLRVIGYELQLRSDGVGLDDVVERSVIVGATVVCVVAALAEAFASGRLVGCVRVGRAGVVPTPIIERDTQRMVLAHLRNGREAHAAVAVLFAVLRRGLHKRPDGAVFGTLGRQHTRIEIGVPTRRREVEPPDMVVERCRGRIYGAHLAKIAVHTHRPHHTVVEAALERDLQHTARRVGIVVGTRLRYDLDLRDILGTEITYILHELLTRQTHLSVVDIYRGSLGAVYRDAVVVDPYAGRLLQHLHTILSDGARRVSHVDDKAVGLAAYHLRRHHHVAYLGGLLLQHHIAHVEILTHTQRTLHGGITYKFHNDLIFTLRYPKREAALLVARGTGHLTVARHRHNSGIPYGLAAAVHHTSVHVASRHSHETHHRQDDQQQKREEIFHIVWFLSVYCSFVLQI